MSPALLPHPGVLSPTCPAGIRPTADQMTLLDLLDAAGAAGGAAVGTAGAVPVAGPADNAPEPPLADLTVTARCTVTRHLPPPPPKRKLVPTPAVVDLHAALRRATERQAPVAFRIAVRADAAREAWHRDEYAAVTADAPLELRTFDRRLWAPVGSEDVGALFASPEALAAAALPEGMRNVYHSRYWTAPDEADARQALREWAERRLLIGDRLYEPADEPCYRLEADRFDVSLHLASSARPGELAPAYYRADQLPQALAAVRRHLGLAEDAPLVEGEPAGGEATAAADEGAGGRRGRRRRAYYGPTHALTVLRPDAVQCGFRPSPAMPLACTASVKAALTSTSADVLPYGQGEGFVLPDGRRLMPRLAWTLVDERPGAAVDGRAPERALTDAEVAALGVTVNAGSYKNSAGVSRDDRR